MRYLTLIVFLLVSVFSSAQFTFLRNDTIKVFENGTELKNPWTGGLNTTQISKMDLDFDGVEDLVVFDRIGHKLMTFTNDNIPGQAKYSYKPKFEKFFPELYNWILLRDYNCDGLKDIFAYSPAGVQLYKNISSGGLLKFELVTSLIKGWQSPGGSWPANYLNIYVSAVDIPHIGDIDGDNDLDILTFGNSGTTVEYHKNMSVENTGVCDTSFLLKNLCWGKFRESPSDNSVELNYNGHPCDGGNITGSELGVINKLRVAQQRLSRHTGSTLLAFDENGDSVMEFVMGDVSFRNLVKLENGGTAPNTDSPMVNQDTLFPNYNTSVDLQLFPAPFYEDINNDGKRDLIVTTNSPNLSEDKSSIWFYENTNTDAQPIFNFIQKDFIQEGTIDMGSGANPAMFDYNNDGLLDLVIGNKGAYSFTDNDYITKLSLYENTGSIAEPEFTLITDDYANLAASAFEESLHPCFADIDGDSDMDMLLGDSEGNLHLLKNIAAIGSNANFVLTNPLLADNDGNQIDVGDIATPTLVDIDRDNDFDLIIGNSRGTLHYYQNTGDSINFQFTYITDSLGKVVTRLDIDNVIQGYSQPIFKDHNGNYELFLGSNSGNIFHYNNIDGNLNGAFTKVDSTILDYKPGSVTRIAMHDLTNDGFNELIVGNSRGGLTYYQNNFIGIGIEEKVENLDFNIYPNPAKQNFTIKLNQNINKLNIRIFDPIGNLVYTENGLKSSEININTISFSDGLYFVELNSNNISTTKKIIIKH